MVVETPESPRIPPVGVRGLHPADARRGVKRFLELVKARGHTREPEKSKLPRATEMRPYRFCVQDVVLAVWAMAHNKDDDCVEVDVFLTSEVYDRETRRGGYYDPLAGATAATLTILSEAFRVGCPLRVKFTENVEGGWVPRDIELLAERHGIRLAGMSRGLIEPHEGRALYLALTGFQPALRRAIDLLAAQGLLSPERAAYIVHHGVWSLPEVEGIVMCSTYPDLVLSGDVPPEHRHLYQHVQAHARLALMGGLLDRSLQARDYDATMTAAATGGNADGGAGDQKSGLDIEDDERNVDIRTHARFHAREYVLLPAAPAAEGGDWPVADSMPLPPWECDRTELAPGRRLCALLRPRVASSLERYLASDLEAAESRQKADPVPDFVAVVVPFDFHDLAAARQNEYRAEAAKRGVALMVCPETTRALDQMAMKKMLASRIKKD